MASNRTLGNWPNQPPHPGALMEQIREIAKDDSDVYFKRHAIQRFNLRSSIQPLSDLDVIRGFRIAEIVSPITAGDNPDEWKCKVAFPYGEERGDRGVGVVTVVHQGNELFVVTVMWEDEQ